MNISAVCRLLMVSACTILQAQPALSDKPAPNPSAEVIRFQELRKRSRQSMIEAFDVQMRRDEVVGNAELHTRFQEQKRRFESNGTLPDLPQLSLATMKYRRLVDDSHRNTLDAFKQSITEHTRRLELDQAKAVRAESNAFVIRNPANNGPFESRVLERTRALTQGLYRFQNERGTWDPAVPGGTDLVTGTNYGGTTALVTYALLLAGETPDDPRLDRAVKFLSAPTTQMNGVYAVSMRNHVWALLLSQGHDYRSAHERDSEWLQNAIGGGPAKGGYHYTPQQAKAGSYDNSTTQFGVLGAWHTNVVFRGYRKGLTNEIYWRKVEEHFVATANADQGWGYTHLMKSTGSMTAAGVTCLLLVRDARYGASLDSSSRFRVDPLNKRINQGLSWLDANFTASGNPPDAGAVNPYYLASIQRAGILSGYKRFKGTDWYLAGAEALMREDPQGVSNTAFSLIFLAKGRPPVLINKLRVPGQDWNNRPRDIAAFASWFSGREEREHGWGVVSADEPVENWSDAPVLYYTSQNPLALTTPQKVRLQDYVEAGGLLVTMPEAGPTVFKTEIERLMTELFPGVSMESLPPDHPVFEGLDNDDRPEIKGLFDGRSYFTLHVSTDLFKKSRHSPWLLFQNIYRYGLSLRPPNVRGFNLDVPALQQALRQIEKQIKTTAESGNLEAVEKLLAEKEKLNQKLKELNGSEK